MTSMIERIVAIIAPNSCIACSSINNVLCNSCLEQLLLDSPFCVFCASPTNDWHVCRSCRHKTSLNKVWVGAEYAGVVQEIIKLYKFERLKAAYLPLAHSLDMTLPFLSDEWLVVAVPTASSRVRQRGYDQANLIARQFAKKRNLNLVRAIQRQGHSRQLGADRDKRQRQVKNSFFVSKPQLVKNRRILLVDDVCTTGATLTAVADSLKKAGAAEVCGAVCAWQAPKTPRHL